MNKSFDSVSAGTHSQSHKHGNLDQNNLSSQNLTQISYQNNTSYNINSNCVEDEYAMNYEYDDIENHNYQNTQQLANAQGHYAPPHEKLRSIHSNQEANSQKNANMSAASSQNHAQMYGQKLPKNATRDKRADTNVGQLPGTADHRARVGKENFKKTYQNGSKPPSSQAKGTLKSGGGSNGGANQLSRNLSNNNNYPQAQ